MSRYKHKNGDVLDTHCGDIGHTMFIQDVVRDLNNLETVNDNLIQENVGLRHVGDKMAEVIHMHHGACDIIKEWDEVLEAK